MKQFRQIIRQLNTFPIACAITAVAILISVLVGLNTSKADMLKVRQDNYVCDGANLLSEETEATMAEQNAKLDTEHTAYMAVATVKHLRGWEPVDYASVLFEKWNLKGNDLLLLVCEKTKDAYLYYGASYDSFDYVSCLKEYVLPQLSEGNFEAAVIGAYEGVGEYLNQIGGIYSSDTSAVVKDTSAEEQEAEDASASADSSTEATAEDQQSTGKAGKAIVAIILILLILAAITEGIDRYLYHKWYEINSAKRDGRYPFKPVFFWHQPGGTWYRYVHKPLPPRKDYPQERREAPTRNSGGSQLVGVPRKSGRVVETDLESRKKELDRRYSAGRSSGVSEKERPRSIDSRVVSSRPSGSRPVPPPRTSRDTKSSGRPSLPKPIDTRTGPKR